MVKNIRCKGKRGKIIVQGGNEIKDLGNKEHWIYANSWDDIILPRS